MSLRRAPVPLNRDLTGSAAAVLAGSLAAIAGGLAVRVVVARALTPADLGALLLGISVVSFAGGVASMGLRMAAARRVSELVAAGDPARATAAAWTTLLASAAGGAVGAALVVAVPLLRLPGLGQVPRPILFALTPVAFALAVGTGLWGVSQGFGDTRGRALLRDTGGASLRLVGVVVAAALGGGAVAIALGWTAGCLGGELLFLVYGLRRRWLRAVPPRLDRPLLASLPPYAGAALLNQARTWLDMLLVGLLAPLPVVALYGLAQSIFRVLGMVGTVAAHRFLPQATFAVSRHDEGRLALAYRQSRALSASFLWVALAPCLLCPREVVGLAFGPAYAGAVVPLQVLAAGLLVPSLLGYAEETLVARGRPAAVISLGGMGMGVSAALALLLIPRLGAVGAAVATAVGVVLRGWAGYGLLGRQLRSAVWGGGAWWRIPAQAAPALAAALIGTGWPGAVRLASVAAGALPPALFQLRALIPRRRALPTGPRDTV